MTKARTALASGALSSALGIAVAAAIAAPAGASTTPSTATTPTAATADRLVTITSEVGERPMAVSPDATDPNAGGLLYIDPTLETGAVRQQWRLVSEPDGYVLLRNAQSGNCAKSTGYVGLLPCDATNAAQLFTLHPADDGSVTLVSKFDESRGNALLTPPTVQSSSPQPIYVTHGGDVNDPANRWCLWDVS